MAIIKARNILYTPCSKCSKHPYDCNYFNYLVDTSNNLYAVPIPKSHKKECYKQVEILKI